VRPPADYLEHGEGPPALGQRRVPPGTGRALGLLAAAALWPVGLLALDRALPGPVTPQPYQTEAPGPVAAPASDADSPTRGSDSPLKMFWEQPGRIKISVWTPPATPAAPDGKASAGNPQGQRNHGASRERHAAP
jgi:hypothetical protein